MKDQQFEEAKNLYYQTEMTKAEIAQNVGVSRRTILRWCKEDDWERLRQSYRVMPALVVEKCYFILNNMLTRMAEESYLIPTFKETQSIHLIASTIKKLKNRCTINESMEMFNFFLEGLKKKDPKLAADILPKMEEYISERSKKEVTDFLPEELIKDPHPDPNHIDKDEAEQIADEKDLRSLEKERQFTPNYEQALANWEKYIDSSDPPNVPNNDDPGTS